MRVKFVEKPLRAGLGQGLGLSPRPRQQRQLRSVCGIPQTPAHSWEISCGSTVTTKAFSSHFSLACLRSPQSNLYSLLFSSVGFRCSSEQWVKIKKKWDLFLIAFEV